MARRKKPNHFSKILNELMNEHGATVREVARIADVGASTVQAWRAGSLPTDFVAIQRLASHFGTTLCFLLTGGEENLTSKTLSMTEIFSDEGTLFDGYAKILIKKLIPRGTSDGEGQ